MEITDLDNGNVEVPLNIEIPPLHLFAFRRIRDELAELVKHTVASVYENEKGETDGKAKEADDEGGEAQ